MSPTPDPSYRDRWARLRFSIIGHLLAAPPEPGELRRALTELAAKSWRHPMTGLPVRFGFSTLERWFYAVRAHADPVAGCATVRAPISGARAPCHRRRSRLSRSNTRPTRSGRSSCTTTIWPWSWAAICRPMPLFAAI